MRTIPLLLLALLSACGGTEPHRRSPVVPLGPTDRAPPPVEPEKRVRTESDKSPPPPPAETPPGDAGVAVTWRTVTQVVEKPVEVQRQETPSQRVYEPYYSYDPYAYPRDYYSCPSRCEEPWVPVNTMVGAGIGALIGDAHGKASDGAWIGAGIGLMFDLGRLCW